MPMAVQAAACPGVSTLPRVSPDHVTAGWEIVAAFATARLVGTARRVVAARVVGTARVAGLIGTGGFLPVRTVVADRRRDVEEVPQPWSNGHGGPSESGVPTSRVPLCVRLERGDLLGCERLVVQRGFVDESHEVLGTCGPCPERQPC